MDLFWYLILALLAFVTYLSGLSNPNGKDAILFYGSILAMSGLFFSSGVDVPGAGFTISGSTITNTSTSYTIDNMVLVLAGAWGTFMFGIKGFYEVLLKHIRGGVNADGTFK